MAEGEQLAELLERLTDKQRLFVLAYVGNANANATRAAIAAGYSPASARFLGHETLTKPYVREAIDALYAAAGMTVGEVTARLAEQARNEIAAYLLADARGRLKLDTRQLLADGKAHLIREIATDAKGRQLIKTFDAQAALALVGRHHAMFTDNVNQSVEATVKAYGFDPESGADQP